MEHESIIRIGAFAGVFLVMALWELASPRRPRSLSRGVRWLGNLGLIVCDTLILRVAFPVAAMGVAAIAAERGWGLFNNLAWSPWLTIPLSVLALDMAIYFQHVMFHAVPVLWRLHMVHHADLDLDVTSGLRFHPIEMVLSMVLKIALVAALGPPVVAVLIFEVLLNATSMFNHSNVRIPDPVDRFVRLAIVTPDMHRVHHSIKYNESNSNFGFNSPWWDRLFGTYTPQPAAGHDGMTIGLEQFLQEKKQTLWWLLKLPFAGRGGAYPLNKRPNK